MGRHLHAVTAPFTPGTSGAVRVVLVDDHASMRRSLRRLLEREDDMEVVAEAGDLESGLDQVRAHRPQVVVLDLRMPDGSCVEQVMRLRAASPGVQVVVTMLESGLFAERALGAGAIGFVLKDTADVELCDAVRRAARGLGYRSPRVGRR